MPGADVESRIPHYPGEFLDNVVSSMRRRWDIPPNLNRGFCQYMARGRLGSDSISHNTSYREIPPSLEGARSGVKILISLWNLTDASDLWCGNLESDVNKSYERLSASNIPEAAAMWCTVIKYWEETDYHQASSISRTISKHLNLVCLVLQLSLANPLKTDVKWRMKI